MVPALSKITGALLSTTNRLSVVSSQLSVANETKCRLLDHLPDNIGSLSAAGLADEFLDQENLSILVLSTEITRYGKCVQATGLSSCAASSVINGQLTADYLSRIIHAVTA